MSDTDTVGALLAESLHESSALLVLADWYEDRGDERRPDLFRRVYEAIHDDDVSLGALDRYSAEDLIEPYARSYAYECAERVLSLWDAERPNDDRPRAAIKLAKRWFNGGVANEKLQAASDAARTASDVAWAASPGARAAAHAAAQAAVGNAARAASSALFALKVDWGDTTLARNAAKAVRMAEQRWQALRLATFAIAQGSEPR